MINYSLPEGIIVDSLFGLPDKERWALGDALYERWEGVLASKLNSDEVNGHLYGPQVGLAEAIGTMDFGYYLRLGELLLLFESIQRSSERLRSLGIQRY